MHKILIIISLLGLTCALFAQSPHGSDFKINCAACHSSATWEIAVDTFLFNHDTTAFTLTGHHLSVDCRDCHETLKFEEASTECISCHTDIHRSTVGADCALCRTRGARCVPSASESRRSTSTWSRVIETAELKDGKETKVC